MLIQAYTDIKRISKALTDEPLMMANSIFDSITSSFDLQLVRALWNKYDKYELECSDYYEINEKIKNIKKEVVSELLKKFDNGKELFNYLERKLNDLEKAEIQYQPYEFLSLLGFSNYEITKELCTSIISDSSCILSSYLSALMSGIRNKNKKETINLSKLALKTNNKKIINSLAQGYSGRDWTLTLDNEDVKLIKTLLEYRNEDIKSNTIMSLGRFKGKWKQLSIELALEVEIGDSEQLANALCDIFDENSIKIEELKYDGVKHILNKLILIKILDNNLYYNLQKFIGYCSNRYPDLVVDFFLNRILFSKGKEWTWPNRYEPFPHHFHEELKISEHPNYINILKKVRDKSIDTNFNVYLLSELYAVLSNNFSSISLQVLYEWINSMEIKKIEAVVLLVSNAPSDFVFINKNFVSQLLDNAYVLDKEAYKNIRDRLLNLNFSIRSYDPSSSEDIEIIEQSQKMLKKFPKNSPTGQFYFLMFKNAQNNVKKPWIDQEEFDE